MSDKQHATGEIIPFGYSAAGGNGGLAEGGEELQLGWETEVIRFGEPGPRRHCRGTGSFTLLVTARACDASLGTGQIRPVLRREQTPAAWGHSLKHEI